MKCKNCKEEMVKCGFGDIGSLAGNARYECRNEKCKDAKKGEYAQ